MPTSDPAPARTPLRRKNINVTVLYRFYAAEGPPNFGCPLYVGISLDAMQRARQHNKNSDWMNGSMRITIERFTSRAAAERAEVEAIRTECPAFNIKHAVHEDVRVRHHLAREAGREAEASRLRAEMDAVGVKHRLTVRGIASLVSRGKPGLYGDGNNLFLKIDDHGGSASWIFRYQRDGRREKIGLGPLHTIGLRDARIRAYQARRLLHAGLDPRDDPRFKRSRAQHRKR